jgi:hypothetical protein
MVRINGLVDIHDAAKSLGVLPRQVRNLITKGMLPAQKLGGSYVIKGTDLAKVPKVRKPGPKPKGK